MKKLIFSPQSLLGTLAVAALFSVTVSTAQTEIVSSIESLSERIPVGDPTVHAIDRKEGPKAITTSDLDGDGQADLAVANLDGTVTLLFGVEGGGFLPPRHLATGAEELRAVEAADYNGDGMKDLAIASPQDSKLLLFFNTGGGNFGDAVPLPAWAGVRSIASGDFDGDGVTDLAAAGPGVGVRHFRGLGKGSFEVMGDLPRISPELIDLPKPVYAMHVIRSLDGQRDDLLVTHAESDALYVLSTQAADRGAEPPMVTPAAWGQLTPDVLMTEVQVLNRGTLLDADGETQPWVELYNKSSEPVNLGGWVLSKTNQQWVLPGLTLEPGRFAVVYLSGKDRSGFELHANFSVDDETAALVLTAPGGEAHSLSLEPHSVGDISYGLSPGTIAPRWFDLPSPGASNNAGFRKLSAVRVDDNVTTLTLTPMDPSPGERVVVKVNTPSTTVAEAVLKDVWFSVVVGLEEKHYPLKRLDEGAYAVTLEAGVYTEGASHRILARYRKDDGEDDFTLMVHPGLDDQDPSDVFEQKVGRLLPVASVPSPRVKAFDIGAITRQAGKGVLQDLVYADDECGLLRVHRGVATVQRFENLPAQDMQIRGAPRDVRLADIDSDGWMDATVVLRGLDLALTCGNEKGSLKAIGELATGNSPRAVAMADFSGDGMPDAAVINRHSSDVSILTTSANVSGLVSNDQIYPVDGEVSGLLVVDYDGDGRDDVVQLHRGSGEVSVRYSNEDGSLRDPVFLTILGGQPSGIATADINGDGILDTVTANLGGGGSVSTLLSQPNGTWIQGPTTAGIGSMFAISVADFDSDGYQDLVTGLFDCRVTFFRGDGTGNFTMTRTQSFAYESRVMVVGDFDQDGDPDIAGAGLTGKLVVLQNDGNMLESRGLRRDYPPPSGAFYGAERIALFDADGDSDPDLVMGSGRGVVVYRGGAGTSFTYDQTMTESTPDFEVNDVVTLDLDGDDKEEMVVLCREAACLNILTQTEPGAPFTPVTQATVPGGRYLGTGDLDGDGKPDLVSTGDVLWTVLSSRPPEIAAPRTTESQRETSSGVLINEVLSRNTGTPVALDGGRKTDFVEIYNSTDSVVSVGGWKIQVVGTQEGAPFNESHTLPGISIEPKGYAVVLFSDETESNPDYTGFNLPAERTTVTLKRSDDSVADTTQTPPSLENVSWSRFIDGHPVFHANPIPSPAMSNIDNGTPAPDVKLTAPSPESLAPGQPIRFTAKGKDDVGIVSLSLLWKPLGVPGETQRVILYDDGMHDDGAVTDGFFAGEMATGLAADGEIQFYMEATDLSGNTVIVPDDATLVDPGERPNAWTISLKEAPSLEIVEVAPYGNGARQDESGKKADYVVVRNSGTGPVEMRGVLLSKSPLSSGGESYSFPPELVLSPGAETVVFADDDTEDGPMHAPFTLDGGGGDLSLLAETDSGARRWIDSLVIPASPNLNARYVKLPGTDRWTFTTVSDLISPVGLGNPLPSYDEQGEPLPSTTIATIAGHNYRLDGLAPNDIPNWQTIRTFTGDGSEMSFVHEQRKFTTIRAVHLPPLPEISMIGHVKQISQIEFQVEATYATGVEIYTSRVGALTGNGPADFPLNTRRVASEFGSLFVNRTTGPVGGNPLYARIRAFNSTGEVWSEPMTISDSRYIGSFSKPGLSDLNESSATLTVQMDYEVENVKVLYGREDRFGADGENGWTGEEVCSLLGDSGTWSANVGGLIAGERYYARFAGTDSSGREFLSRERIEFLATSDPNELTKWALRFSEIMYHPLSPSPEEAEYGFVEDDFEFLELYNAGDQPIDLSGWYFERGIDITFPLSGGPVLGSGEYGVLAAHPHAFAMRYGADIPLMAWTLHPFRQAKLSNGGETLALHSPDGGIQISTYYNDRTQDDGNGWSLEYSSGNWITSSLYGGSPGFDVPTRNLNLSNWQNANFSAEEQANPTVSGLNADPDSDGLSNYEEFLFGESPKSGNGRDQLRFSGFVERNGDQFVELELRQSSRVWYTQVQIESIGGVVPRVLFGNRDWFEVGGELSEDRQHVYRKFIVRWFPEDQGRGLYRLRFP